MTEPLAVPVPETPEKPRLGMIARFLAVFTDPRRAFLSIRKNHEWVLILALISILGLGVYQFTKPIIKKDVIARVEESLKNNPNVPEERRQEIVDSIAQRFENPLWQLLTPAWMLVAMLVVSGVLLFLGNILMGGQTNFRDVLNMYALTWLVAIPENIVKVPLMLSKGTMKVETSLALLVSSENTSQFLQVVLGKFDLFGLWQLALVVVGVALLSRSSVAKAAWTVGAVWFIWVLIQAGLASMGIQFGA